MARMFSRARAQPWRLFAYLVMFVGASALINAWIFIGDGESWAQSLTNPAWSPPGYVIAVVWTLLFGTMAAASYLIDQDNEPRFVIAARLGVILWWVACMIWPVLYFQVQEVANGFYTTVQAITVGFIVLPVVYQASPRAALTLLPLQIWLCFALFLAWRTWQLNA